MLDRPIFILGFMGCGKSTFGKKLARELNVEFVDLDAAIEQQTGRSLTQFFKSEGEAAFRDIEREMLRNVLADKGPCVVATGGGTPCFFDNMDRMREQGYTLYLQLSNTALCQRLRNSMARRPLLEDMQPDELFPYVEQTMAARQQYYERAHIIAEATRITTGSILNTLAYMKEMGSAAASPTM